MKVRRPRGLLLALIGSLALAVPAGAGGAQTSDEMAYALVKEIEQHRAQTWHRQRVMGIRRTRTTFLERRVGSSSCCASCETPGGRAPRSHASGSSARRTERPGSASTGTRARGRIRTRPTTAGCRWTSRSSAPTAAISCGARAPRTAGLRPSRCGRPRRHSAPAAGSTRGRTRRGTAACSRRHVWPRPGSDPGRGRRAMASRNPLVAGRAVGQEQSQVVSGPRPKTHRPGSDPGRGREVSERRAAAGRRRGR